MKTCNVPFKDLFQLIMRFETEEMNFVFYRTEKGWVMSHVFFDGNALTFFSGGG